MDRAISRILLTAVICTLTSFWPARAKVQDPEPAKCFPTEIEGLTAIQFPQDRQEAVHKYRNTQIAGYDAAEFNTAVTVYVYDKEPITELAQEFRASGSEVLALHTGAESPMSGPSKLAVAGRPTDGFLGVFLWTEGETDFGSFLWVGDVSGKYVKIRATYIRPEMDDQTAPAMRFAMAAMRNVANHACTKF